MNGVVRAALGVLLAVAALLATVAARASGAETETGAVRAQHLAHLLAYLDADYARFGSEEQSEHLSLAARAAELARGLASPADVEARAGAIGALLRGRPTVAELHARVAELSLELEGAYRFEVAPREAPDLARGRALYETHCASCHGVTGRADTEVAATLRPHPASFAGATFGESIAPYDVTTAIRFGVDATAMAPVDALDASERWDVAFYVLGLRHPQAATVDVPRLTRSELASKTDAELRADLFAAGVAGDELDAALAGLRRTVAFDAQSSGGALGDVRERLDEARRAVVEGDRASALAALADAQSGAEAIARPLDPRLAETVHATFARVAGLVRSGVELLPVTSALDGVLALVSHVERLTRTTGAPEASSRTAWDRTRVVRTTAIAALAFAALLAGLLTTRRIRRRPALAWMGAGALGLAIAVGLTAARPASGASASAGAWPSPTPEGDPSPASSGEGQGTCSGPGFDAGPALHAIPGAPSFDVTNDCLFPGHDRLEIAVRIAGERPTRAEVEVLLRGLLDEVQSSSGPAMPDLTHVCAFPAGDAAAAAYGCLELESDEGPEGELSVHVDIPFETSQWVPGFAARHARGFVGDRRPEVTVDATQHEVVVTYPFVEPGTGEWARHLRAGEAAAQFFAWAFDFYPPQTEAHAMRFVGVWRDKTVMSVRVADLDSFLSMGPWGLRERMASARIPLEPGADRTASQNEALYREYADALAKLPKGSVVIDGSLASSGR